MIKYNKSGKVIEKYLTKKEATDMKYMRENAIRETYKKLAHKSQGIRDRYDELFNNDYLLIVPRDRI